MASHQIVPVRLLSTGCNHHKRAKRSRQEWFRTPSPSFSKPVAKMATEHRMKHQHSTNIHNNCFHALDPLHSWISMYVCASPHKCAVTTNMRTHVHTCTYMHAHAHTCNQSSSSNWFVEGCRSWSVPKMSPGLSFPRRVAVLLEVDATPTHTHGPVRRHGHIRTPPPTTRPQLSCHGPLPLPAESLDLSCMTTSITKITRKYFTTLARPHRSQKMSTSIP